MWCKNVCWQYRRGSWYRRCEKVSSYSETRVRFLDPPSWHGANIFPWGLHYCHVLLWILSSRRSMCTFTCPPPQQLKNPFCSLCEDRINAYATVYCRCPTAWAVRTSTEMTTLMHTNLFSRPDLPKNTCTTRQSQAERWQTGLQACIEFKLWIG